MDRRFTITIRGDAAERLSALAVAERRDPREQAALIIEQALARLADRTGSSTGASTTVPPDERPWNGR